MKWATTRFEVDLSQPRIMGIVNVTPDSFSDGGDCADARSALRRCETLLEEGAELLDIGGESTRPGSPPLPLQEELARIMPVLRGALQLGIPVSVDTYKPQVMQAVLDAGVDIINDVRALREPGASAVIARHGSCGVCLMHMHREPRTMQQAPMQGDAVPQVREFLEQRAAALLQQGVQRSRIVLDPGIGFGKTVAQNFALLARQEALLAMGFPLLVGWSRKSSLGAALQGSAATPPPPRQRLVAGVAAALMAVERGASVVRVHDVKATADALAVWRQVRTQQLAQPEVGTS
ncbi:MAG: dihydropteroate synthase [Ottowia sp.]|nr:dihydropteroate synthase [Ottowia sp.]